MLSRRLHCVWCQIACKHGRPGQLCRRLSLLVRLAYLQYAGDHRIHQQGHGNRDESPRDAYHVSYQVPGSYVAASARPQRPEYNEAFDDRSPPRDGYPHSAREPPAQEAPQSKDRSEGREFFRR